MSEISKDTKPTPIEAPLIVVQNNSGLNTESKDHEVTNLTDSKEAPPSLFFQSSQPATDLQTALSSITIGKK